MEPTFRFLRLGEVLPGQFVGHNPDENGDYLGLGWLDEGTYLDRVRRLTAGDHPIAG